MRTDDELYEYRRRKVMLFKWEVVRKKKNELLLKLQKMKERVIFVNIWLQLIKKHLKVKKFENNVRRKILDKIKKIKTLF